MAAIHIVTDSGACFGNKRLSQQYPMTVVPYQLEVGGTTFRDGTDLTPDETLKLLRTQSKPPRLIAPSVSEYVEVYQALKQKQLNVISIHTSRELSQSWDHARQAALRMGENSGIAVIDSRTICAGQGLLIQVAAQAISEQVDLDEVVKRVRSAIDRTFSAYYVETLTYLQHNGIMSAPRSILGTMLEIKPFLSIEGGRLLVTEKVRTRAQALDKLVEFTSEFDDIAETVIVQNRASIMDQTRTLQDNLSAIFPGQHFPYTTYSVAMGVLLGADAIGVAVLENELEGF